MRAGIMMVAMMLAGCAADAGTAPMTAVYSPPVRPGGTGQMLFLPAPRQPALPIEALPHPAALVQGKGVFRGEATLADAAACRARLTAIAARAARRYPAASGITVMPEEDELTILGSWTPPVRVLRFRCEGARMVREDGRASADPFVPPPPLPPIRTASVPR